MAAAPRPSSRTCPPPTPSQHTEKDETRGLGGRRVLDEAGHTKGDERGEWGGPGGAIEGDDADVVVVLDEGAELGGGQGLRDAEEPRGFVPVLLAVVVVLLLAPLLLAVPLLVVQLLQPLLIAADLFLRAALGARLARSAFGARCRASVLGAGLHAMGVSQSDHPEWWGGVGSRAANLLLVIVPLPLQHGSQPSGHLDSRGVATWGAKSAERTNACLFWPLGDGPARAHAACAKG